MPGATVPNTGGPLLTQLYEPLRALAARLLRTQRVRTATQATSLLHETMLRLAQRPEAQGASRSHFLLLAARAMRFVLVDQARARAAQKRGGGRAVQLQSDCLAPQMLPPVDLLALDEALRRLAQMDARKAQVVELRFFAGLSIAETAELLGVSPACVKRHWALARAWLYREMQPDELRPARAETS